MIQSSSSPTLHSDAHSPSSRFPTRSHYDDAYRTAAKLSHPGPIRPSHFSSASHAPSRSSATVTEASTSTHSKIGGEYFMTGALVDAEPSSPSTTQPEKASTNKLPSESPASQSSATAAVSNLSVTGTKRGTPNSPPPQVPTAPDPHVQSARSISNPPQSSSSKRLRGASPAIKLLPVQYEYCNPNDLATVISSMLMELIRYNDDLPINAGHLTRFHSRAPPGISVADYLQRLTTHATLSPPILLSMVYYIDRLCALYPAFTISSLTVHRFLITSATVASKGLSDSFWTNKIYARVGGLSLKELALLELDFLSRMEWRIVPKPEVLVDYYRSLVDRSDGYEIDITGKLEVEKEEMEARKAEQKAEKVDEEGNEKGKGKGKERERSDDE